jgi:hypothetical protein
MAALAVMQQLLPTIRYEIPGVVIPFLAMHGLFAGIAGFFLRRRDL